MLAAGELFAGYTVERMLGAGGMGEVYVARHPRLPRNDALKVLAPHLGVDPQFRARFEREADLAASLSHPGIVKVHDRGDDAGRLWIAMELVDGTDLAHRVRESGPLGANQCSFVVSAIADALDYAATRGLVHRDVKPANILLSVDGHILLTDFGIARIGADSSELTGTGVTIGTVNYASPEQLQGLQLDGRSDQYSLACTTFQLLTGEAPFADPNSAVVIAGHLGRPLPSVRNRRPDLSPQIDEVLAQAASKNPGARYGSCNEFAAAFARACAVPDSERTSVLSAMPLASTGDDANRTVVGATPERWATVGASPAGVARRGGPIEMQTPRPKSRRGVIATVVAVLAVSTLVAGFVLLRSAGDDSATPRDASSPSDAAASVLDPCSTRFTLPEAYRNYIAEPSGCSGAYGEEWGRVQVFTSLTSGASFKISVMPLDNGRNRNDWARRELVNSGEIVYLYEASSWDIVAWKRDQSWIEVDSTMGYNDEVEKLIAIMESVISQYPK